MLTDTVNFISNHLFIFVSHCLKSPCLLTGSEPPANVSYKYLEEKIQSTCDTEQMRCNSPAHKHNLRLIWFPWSLENLHVLPTLKAILKPTSPCTFGQRTEGTGALVTGQLPDEPPFSVQPLRAASITPATWLRTVSRKAGRYLKLSTLQA